MVTKEFLEKKLKALEDKRSKREEIQKLKDKIKEEVSEMPFFQRLKYKLIG